MTQLTDGVSTGRAPLSSDLVSSGTCHSTHVAPTTGTCGAPPYHTAPSTHTQAQIHKDIDIERHIGTDRQTPAHTYTVNPDRQTDIQTDRQTDRQTATEVLTASKSQ